MIAIVLAGGLGTRLGELTSNCPKPMLPINNKPFLDYVLSYLDGQGITETIMAVSYLSKQIEDYYSNQSGVKFSVEEHPAGTGGAIKKALEKFNVEEAIVVNGDTIFQVPLKGLMALHYQSSAQISIALKSLSDCGRYGQVIRNDRNRVTMFTEKGSAKEGNINGGVYAVRKDAFSNCPSSSFSFETDLLATSLDSLDVYGYEFDNYFLDMGVPEDYQQALNDAAFW